MSRRTHATPQPAPLPLFAWAARQHRPNTPRPRLLLRDDLRDAEGAPRACIVIPGQRAPLAFHTLSGALAELRRMEARP